MLPAREAGDAALGEFPAACGVMIKDAQASSGHRFSAYRHSPRGQLKPYPPLAVI